MGEPTNLDFATAQRGLMMVDLVARGDQRHAGYAAADGEFVNAALVLARDLLRLDGLFDERTHPVLGHTTATPTMLDAGVSRNVTPPVGHRHPGRPQHAGLDPRGDRRAARARGSTPRWS